MSGLDLVSVIIVSSLMSGLLALVLFLMRRSYPSHIHGLGHWAVAAMLWFAVTLLFVASGNPAFPEYPLIYVSNLLLLLSNIVYLKGLQHFEGRPAPWRRWLVFLGIMAVVTIWLTFVQTDYAPRLFVMILALGAIYLSTLVATLRFKTRRLPIHLITWVLVAHLSVIALRLMQLGAVESFFEQTLIQSIYVGSFAVAQLLYSIGAILLATDRLAMENARQARYDHLTGLHNRRSLLQQCAEDLLRVQRGQRGAALMLLDIDHFKRINDSHGHQHGDRVLQHFARQVGGILPPGVRFGRYGGEEFVVMLPEADAGQAMEVAERIHQTLDSGHPLDCKVSIGLTVWQEGDTLESMLARADGALYAAKEQGRNRTCTA